MIMIPLHKIHALMAHGQPIKKNVIHRLHAQRVISNVGIQLVVHRHQIVLSLLNVLPIVLTCVRMVFAWTVYGVRIVPSTV